MFILNIYILIIYFFIVAFLYLFIKKIVASEVNPVDVISTCYDYLLLYCILLINVITNN